MDPSIKRKKSMAYAFLAAAAFGITSWRCSQRPNLLTLIPMQVAILAVAVALGTARDPYKQLSSLGKATAYMAAALAALPWVNPDRVTAMERDTLIPAIEWWGLDAIAPLTRVQVAGVSSTLGYMAFVEIIRWYIGPAPPRSSRSSNGGAAGGTANAAAAPAPDKLNGEPLTVYARRRKALQAGEAGHNVGLAVLSAVMLLGILRSCLVSGKLESLHAFLCEPFREDPVFVLTAYVFFWSKFWEWGDSALLLAKGKEISWLHYTHHASTALLTMMNMEPRYAAMWSVACATNSFVHAWMYAYYWRPHALRKFRRALTRAQISQHAAVLISGAYVLRALGWTPLHPVTSFRESGSSGIIGSAFDRWAKGSSSGAGANDTMFVFVTQRLRDVMAELKNPLSGGSQTADIGTCANDLAPILAGLSLYVMYLLFFMAFYSQTYVKKQLKASGNTPRKPARSNGVKHD